MIPQKSRQFYVMHFITFPTLKHYENFIYGLNQVAPNIANKIDDNLPFSHLGDMTKSERYINAEKALKANPNIERVVGHSLGGLSV